mgnify:CR=1 FL=1
MAEPRHQERELFDYLKSQATDVDHKKWLDRVKRITSTHLCFEITQLEALQHELLLPDVHKHVHPIQMASWLSTIGKRTGI